MEVNSLLGEALSAGASDLHLVKGVPPTLRVNGELSFIPEKEVLTKEGVKELVFQLLSEEQKELFLTNKELDFSFDYQGKARFRINAYYQRDSMAAALRLIPKEIRTVEELNLPAILHQFAKLRQGFILVTGPTGHGKSTTLAAVIDEINQNRTCHVVTIEDPIEYVYDHKRAIISQREMHQDTHSWSVALRSVLREDPDVVLIGEMRDYETIASALTIAETGHLVFATLHTNSAAQTVDRIVDVFPEHQQAQVRMQLSATLEAVLSQRLMPAIEGGRVPGCEILLATPAVRTTIREGKTHLIDNIIQTSGELGMMVLESHLAELVKRGVIEVKVAEEYSLRPEMLSKILGGRK